MQFIPYHPTLRAACLAIFNSNVPAAFGAVEREPFLAYLDQPEGPYFVLEVDQKQVGCGGILTAGHEGRLCWGMIHSDDHGRGLGRALRDYRLALLETSPSLQRIVLSTSQHTQAFYAQRGFTVTNTLLNGWAAGLHRVDMAKPFL